MFSAPGAGRPNERGQGGRRRRGWLPVVVGLLAWALLSCGGDDGAARDPSSLVPAHKLSSDEVCELLPPSLLEQVYGTTFRPAKPFPPFSSSSSSPTDASTATTEGLAGERSFTDSLDEENGGCRWEARSDAGVVVDALSLAVVESTISYDTLRPDDAAELEPAVGDGAFFLDASRQDAGQSEVLVLRSGGVVLAIGSYGSDRFAATREQLADVAGAAVANLPAD